MSGFVGLVHGDGAPVDRELLRRMTDSLAFRGPDALEIWAAGPVGFGHAMLRTTDEAATERQPMSLDGQVWITADARVDARSELVGKLRAQGRDCSNGVTDPELILHAYDVWGEECIQHLLGDFAFAIWDGRQRRLFCARDHFGVKPFYYAEVAGGLVFSNTLNCVRLHPDVSDELNDAAIGDFLLFEFNQDPGTTTFAAIRRLLPAHVLVWLDGAAHTTRYWTPPVEEPVRYKRASDCVEDFLEVFERAVADRLRTNRIGVLMSGGLDSTSVAAIAKRLLLQRERVFDLRAYTVVYDQLIRDEEGRYARVAASALDIPLCYVPGHNYGVYEHWDAPELFRPEPVHDPLAALGADLYRKIAAHCRVTLTGDGGDVLLHSQSGPYIAYLLRRMQLGRLLSELGGYILSHGRIPPLLVGIRSTMSRWMGRPSHEPEFPSWLNPEFASRLDLRARWDAINRTKAATHPFKPKVYETLQAPFWPYEFESADPGVTQIPVEMRSPLFDLRLVRLLLPLPPVPWCVDKKLLRVAMRGILPEQVRLRRKTPLPNDLTAKLLKCPEGNRLNQSEPVPDLARYALRGEVRGTDAAGDYWKTWVNLRPLSLNNWLLQNSLFVKYKCVREENRESSAIKVAQKNI